MADADYDDYYEYGGYTPGHAAGDGGGRWQRLINGAGALTSLALMAGIAVWGYKLAVRDVNGIPVIRALEGPARVAPENPGGELALHQGMAVNRIAAEGTAGEPADRLTLAPAPTGLAEDDAAMGTLSGTTRDMGEDGAKFVRVPQGEERLQPAAMRPIEPLPDGPAEPINTEDGAPFVAPVVIPVSVPGVSRSLLPARKPAAGQGATVSVPASADATEAGASSDEFDAVAEAAAAAVLAAMTPAAEIDLNAATLAPGTRLVQIGAYPNEAEARLEWDQTTTRFAALMQGKRRVIEEATSGGQTFYRLRVEGFAGAEDAQAFCAALKAENAVCVPATVK